MNQPNVLFIFPDQLGAKWLPAYGNTDVETPNIDRFAQESLVFDRAYTVSPLCTPARAALFTGRYPCQTGITQNSCGISGFSNTLPEELGRAGYETIHLGKWHLAGPPCADRWVEHEERAGFKTFIGWEALHVDHWGNNIWSDEDPESPIKLRGHETDALTEIALRELENTGNKPFFMDLSYQAPHEPCLPPLEYLDIYRNKAISGLPNTDWRAQIRPNYLGQSRAEWTHGTQSFMEHYFGEITHLDAAFGRLLAKLDELDLADNTIVILTSDHGEMSGSHGRFGKQVPQEEATRIPLMIRMPRDDSGHRTQELCSTVDLLPTILGLCGVEIPETAVGIDHSTRCRRKPNPATRDDLIMQLGNWHAIVSDSYKLVMDSDCTTATEFYDLNADCYEQSNCIDHSGYQGKIAELASRLQGWLAKHKRA